MKKGIIDFVKDIVAVVMIIAVCFGGYTLYKNYKTGVAYNDDSYKVETKRNNKYNGVYSLTQLDENGKNTWNGLMLYVKNDKIVSCAKFESKTYDEIRTDITKKYGDKYDNVSNNDLIWEIQSQGDDYELPKGIPGNLNTGFGKTGDFGQGEQIQYSNTLVGEFVCRDKIDFNKVLDIKTDYDYMKGCNIISGYDEESQEVWLSKLLINEKSEYHEGYKLIHYSDKDEVIEKCHLDNGECMQNLNDLFNADLEAW